MRFFAKGKREGGTTKESLQLPVALINLFHILKLRVSIFRSYL
jgi:hypothetical protein